MNSGNKEINLFDCFHFSLITQTTVGYGNMVPVEFYTKCVNILQLLTIFATVVVDLNIF